MIFHKVVEVKYLYLIMPLHPITCGMGFIPFSWQQAFFKKGERISPPFVIGRTGGI